MSNGFLLDTNTILWWLFEPEELTPRARELLVAASDPIFVSAVSAMEIATKFRRGKLPKAARLAGQFAEVAHKEGFEPLAITAAHGDLAGGFRSEHRDPWDRLLAAQGQIEQLVLVTNDKEIAHFGADTFW